MKNGAKYGIKKERIPEGECLMKKTISLALAVVLTLALVLPVRAAEGETMKASPWAVAELERAWEHGVFPEEIDPYRDDCTRGMIRAEFAAITVRLYELLGGKLHQSQSFQQLHPHPFTDIDNYDYDIREAYGLGFVYGVDKERFDPNGTLTREQAAAMLGRVYEKFHGPVPYAEATPFADDRKISAYAINGVALLARNGVVGGIGNNEFAPKKTLTVQEAVIMALRMLESDWTASVNFPPTAFELARSDMSFFAPGEYYSMKIKFTPAYATADVTWTSADPDIASVAWNGVVTAIGPGVTTITATIEGVGSESCIIRCQFKETAAEESPEPETGEEPEPSPGEAGGGTTAEPTESPTEGPEE